MAIEGTKTKDILLGVLGKVRKQAASTKEETVPAQEEDGSSKAGSLRGKMLKYAAMKRAVTNQE